MQPRWLIKQDRIIQVRDVLSIFLDELTTSERVAHQIEEIETSPQETGRGLFRDICNGQRRFGNRAFITIATQMTQQMCGQNVITFYQSTISKRFLGMNGKTALLMSTVLFSWYPFFPVSHVRA